MAVESIAEVTKQDARIPEIVVTHPGDPRLARTRWDNVGYEQAEPSNSEPVYIVVPLNATAERMSRVAERFGVPVKTLEAARRSAPPVVPDVQQQVDFFPRRTSTEHHDWFEFFHTSRRLYRTMGDGMTPRIPNNSLVWGIPLDRPLTIDEEVIVHLRGPDWLSASCLIRQINAVTETQIELVDCYRCDRIVVDRTEIDSIELALIAMGEEGFDNRVDEPRPRRGGGGYAIGCWASANVPQWLRQRQIGRPFLGPDRSRDPWTPALEAA